jgi:membrane associated rhomboid family serine protease
MGIYDRDYAQPEGYTSYKGSWLGFGQTTPVVAWLLILNIAVFVLTWLSSLFARAEGPLQILSLPAFAVANFGPVASFHPFQLWRLVTYQFMHDGIWHILFNMLGLFFLGPTLERYWGSRRFLGFYLMCGIVGGVLYLALSAMHVLGGGILVGASGAILGLLAACAILFPHFTVILFIFPVPIRIAAVILIIISIFYIVGDWHNAGGNAAHLGGMAAGAAYVWLGPAIERLSMRRKSSRWERKMSQFRDLQAEVDRILEKVHETGIQSLTRAERKTLEQATRLEQLRNKL